MTDFNNVVYSVSKAADKLMSHWEIKLPLSGVLCLAEMHLELISIFSALVFIDLFSKWIALSYQNLKDNGRKDIQFIDALKGIKQARRMGVINSHMMKTRFIGKLAVYLLLVFSGGLVDWILSINLKDGDFMVLAISYLAVTELLSIAENLDAAGVEGIGAIAGLIKRRRR